MDQDDNLLQERHATLNPIALLIIIAFSFTAICLVAAPNSLLTSRRCLLYLGIAVTAALALILLWACETGVCSRQEKTAQVVTIETLRAMSGKEFEVWTAGLFRALGYQVENTPDQKNHGVDLKVIKDSEVGIVQCKQTQNNVGEPLVQALLGVKTAEEADQAFMVTTSDFTRAARKWAKWADPNDMFLLNGEKLVALANRAAHRAA